MSLVKSFLFFTRLADYLLDVIQKEGHEDALEKEIAAWDAKRLKKGRSVDAYWKHYVANKLREPDEFMERDGEESATFDSYGYGVRGVSANSVEREKFGQSDTRD